MPPVPRPITATPHQLAHREAGFTDSAIFSLVLIYCLVISFQYICSSILLLTPSIPSVILPLSYCLPSELSPSDRRIGTVRIRSETLTFQLHRPY